MEVETRVALPPSLDLGVFVGRVVVADDMDFLVLWNRSPDQIEELDPFLVPVPLHAGPDDFAVMSGDDFTSMALVLLGGTGLVSVTSNVHPKGMADLMNASLAADVATARKIQYQLFPLMQAMFFDTNPVPAKKALELDPGFAPAANNLAFLLADQDKELDRALELALKAKERLPDDPGVMDTLGWAYYKKGLYDSARSELLDSIEKMPDNAVIHYHLGLTYYKKGEKEKAREELEKALSLDNSFDGAKEAAEVLKKL
jgi:chaperonin cofactor prefoldin